MNVVAIVQARVGSTRLPGKVFELVSGKPLIWHIFERLKCSQKINNLVLATTTNEKDDKLAEWAEQNKFDCFRGSESDVLSRYYHCAKEFNADIVVRITADDPFKDHRIIDKAINFLIKDNLDFVCNNNPPSYPEGMDVEVFTFNALEQSFNESKDPFEREHVTQYIHRNKDIFAIQNLKYDHDLSYLRWTIDTLSDLQMTREVYNGLYKEQVIFSFNEILEFISKNPQIEIINQGEKRSSMYTNIKNNN